jgi:hypothetical protein
MISVGDDAGVLASSDPWSLQPPPCVPPCDSLYVTACYPNQFIDVPTTLHKNGVLFHEDEFIMGIGE